MTLDKAKTLRAAEKFLETGKIAAAIKEYCQIVAVDADDFTTLNMLGDLYTRVGNTSEAISCFRRIAEHYREQGFGLKAIAMYKKIDRLHPHDIEIATNLADLYAQQDLIVEARAHYLSVVEAYNRAGSPQNSLQILRKIADLDPQNTQIRTKLADSYLNHGLKKEAAECFAEAGQVLVSRGALDEALDVFSKALMFSPADPATLRGTLAAHTARGTSDEAAELIEEALRSNPEDMELLSLLAAAYVETENAEEAERVLNVFVAKEPAAYIRFTDVAHLYLRLGKTPEAVNVVANISEQMLAEREQQQLLELINELLAGDADNVEALRLLARAHWWLRDNDSLKDALERLAEAAQAQGLDEDERYALTQLTRLDPTLEAYVTRLDELGGPIEEPVVEVADEPVAEAPPPTVAATEDFVLNSEHVPVSDETTFDWNPTTEVSSDEGVATEATVDTGFSFETIVAQEIPSGASNVSNAETNDSDRAGTMLHQELESVDFYISQGYLDIAVDTLDLLEQQCGSQPEIALRREQIRKAQGGGDASITIEHGEVAVPSEVKAQPPAEPQVVITPPAAPDKAVSQTSPGIDAGLAEIFEEYRVSSESQEAASGNGDYETHYNLGLAYKEMDLFEDALEEFQIAVSLTSPTDGTSRYLQCCNLLGHCFVQTGAPEVAVKWFTKGLRAANISQDEHMALTYEIAAAYETAGDLNRALESFTEVYGNSVTYRNVNERVKTLKARLGEQSAVPPTASRSEQLVN